MLVVDDNADAAESLALLLELAGHTVETAHDGLSALAIAPVFRPEIAFLDLGLPGMSGYDLAKEFRAAPEMPAITLVALTSWGRASDRQRTREAGFDHHFTKPIESDDLKVLIDRLPMA